MKWPWVSRALHEVILSEREATLAFYRAELERRVAEVDRLRDENAKMVEHLRRIDRIEHGVAEVPRAPKRQLEEMSRGVHEYIESWSSPEQKKQMKRDAYERHRRGASWELIEKDLLREHAGNDATTATS